jgi:hypothetical protein
MNRCTKTGLTDKDFKTILDVLNVYDSNDVAHVYPDMGTPEFMQDVQSAFKAVLGHITTNFSTEGKQEIVNDLKERFSNVEHLVDDDFSRAARDQYVHGLS